MRGAMVGTITEGCRRRGRCPYEYLRDAPARLPRLTHRQIPGVTPEARCKIRRPQRTAEAPERYALAPPFSSQYPTPLTVTHWISG
jgi:hypothetical protein